MLLRGVATIWLYLEPQHQVNDSYKH
eukprot:COSAG02_NODE_26164_length_639_cov_1.025926_1_plen_25_part_01